MQPAGPKKFTLPRINIHSGNGKDAVGLQVRPNPPNEFRGIADVLNDLPASNAIELVQLFIGKSRPVHFDSQPQAGLVSGLCLRFRSKNCQTALLSMPQE
jgi:hypothetical protein